MNNLRTPLIIVGVAAAVASVTNWKSQTPDGVVIAENQSPHTNTPHSETTVKAEPKTNYLEPSVANPQNLAEAAPPKKALSDEDQLDVKKREIIQQIVDHFPLSKDGKLEYNNNTKEFLNIMFNALNSHFEDGKFYEADLEIVTKKLEKILPADVSNDAIGLMQNYFAYRTAEQAILVPELNGKELLDMFTQSVQLRRAYLGEDIANKLFAVEEEITRHAIQERILSEDPNLTDKEKTQKKIN